MIDATNALKNNTLTMVLPIDESVTSHVHRTDEYATVDTMTLETKQSKSLSRNSSTKSLRSARNSYVKGPVAKCYETSNSVEKCERRESKEDKSTECKIKVTTNPEMTLRLISQDLSQLDIKASFQKKEQ